MKKYLVINRYSQRDENGNSTGMYVEPKTTVSLSDQEAQRLIQANCIVPLPSMPAVERAVITAPEVRTEQRRRGRPRVR